MTGLAPKTLKVFKDVTTLACIREYVLVGGTALSLQINHRLSEDLDFCKWGKITNARSAIPFKDIQVELEKQFKTVDVNPIDFDQVDYLLNAEVKLQFFNEVGYTLPTRETISLEGNLRVAPIETIGAMKIKTMFQRSVFRDYYDAYAIIKGGHLTLENLIKVGCIYNPKLQPSTIIKRLLLHSKFREERTFGTLNPMYAVSSEEIGKYFEQIASDLPR